MARPHPPPQGAAHPSHIDTVRRFNRFYTRQIGVLQEGLLASPYSLTEARVMFELAHRTQPDATQLGAALGVDPGYLSRILRRFRQQRLVETAPTATDGRRRLLSLTPRGQAAFAQLDDASRREVRAMLARLSDDEQRRLIDAMRTIEQALESPRTAPYLLRPPLAGDLGWVIHRHGVLYAREYGWDERFEAIVADIVAHFVHRYNPKRERCWIAEKDGVRVGSVFLVQKTKTIGQLRLLLVEPRVRGMGIGSRLVSECIRAAQLIGYKTLTLWTDDVLVTARHLYENAGFRLVREERHRTFGPELVGQVWERALAKPVGLASE